MQAVRLHPNDDTTKPFSPSNPAPSSQLSLDSNIPVPQPLQPGQILIRVAATTIVRDALTWPETYVQENQIPGHDFAGTVVGMNDNHAGHPSFELGQAVYGMTDAHRAGAWAQFAIVTTEEACPKPDQLTMAEAASVPMNALTAYQALFEKAGLPAPDLGDSEKARRLRYSKAFPGQGAILVTGAGGCVGMYLVQLAKLAGLYVVAATSSNERNKAFLEGLGIDEAVEYKDLKTSENTERFQVIIDTVGGKVLESCWSLVSNTGTIVSIDSASFDFVQEHQKKGLSMGKEEVNALFFIVSPSRKHLEQVSVALELGLLDTFVSGVVTLSDVQAAYDGGSDMPKERGKLVMTP